MSPSQLSTAVKVGATGTSLAHCKIKSAGAAGDTGAVRSGSKVNVCVHMVELPHTSAA